MSQGTRIPPDYLFTQQVLLRETAKMIALRKGEFPFNQCYHFAPVHPFIPYLSHTYLDYRRDVHSVLMNHHTSLPAAL